MRKILMGGLVAIGLSLGGCSTTSGTGAETSVSNFDGSRSVGISAHGAACTSMKCPMLGATWVEKHPNTVGFTVQVLNEITNINSIAFNIDGEITQLDGIGLTDFDHMANAKISRKSIVADYSVLEKILNSKRTWLRVSTSNGVIEAAIIDGATDSKAFHALKRFDAEVKAIN